MNETQLVRHIKAHIAKGDQAKDKAEQHYIAAGQYLKQLKDDCPDQKVFLEKVEKEIGIGKSRAYELIQISDGRKTVEQVRASGAEREAARRERKKLCPSRDGQNADDPEASAEVMKAAFADEGDSEEVCWRRGLLHRARESAGHALYEDWSHFTVDAQVVTAVKHAAEAWTELAAYLGGLHHKQGKAAPVEAPAHDNDLDIPPFLRRDRVQP